MDLISQLAEKHIQRAQERGEFDNLTGSGQKLDFSADADVPAELRMAYRVLKNAGHVPPELEWRKQIHSIEQLLVQLEDKVSAGQELIKEQIKLRRKLHYLQLNLAAYNRSFTNGVGLHYIAQLREHFTGNQS